MKEVRNIRGRKRIYNIIKRRKFDSLFKLPNNSICNGGRWIVKVKCRNHNHELADTLIKVIHILTY